MPGLPSPDRALLYDKADALYRLAPWTWMHESQLIGLRHPETGELAWLSMMGGGGTHTSLAVYLGEESLHRFNLMHEEATRLAESDSISLILESRQLQASFAQRDELFKPELAGIKTLGRKYRGGNWPTFRSLQPGHAPAIANPVECQWLFHALDQMAAVAPLLRKDQFGDTREGENGTEIITREYTDGQWRTTWTPADTRLFRFPSPKPSELLVAKVSRHSSTADLECGVQLLRNPIGPARHTAIYPSLILSVDSTTGMVVGTEMISVEGQTFEKMIDSVPDCFLRTWDAVSLRPSSITVSSEAARAFLTPTAKALGIPLKHRSRTPALDHCLDSLANFF